MIIDGSYIAKGWFFMTIHTVRRGDTVYSIAREYGIPPTRLITDNILENPGRLVVGQDLIILYPTITHTVRGGDTLERIREQYGVSLIDIYRNNPILGGLPNIYPGQVLNIAYETPPLGEISSNGYAYPYIDRDVLRRTLPYLTYLSVFSYGIRDDGTLLPPAADDTEVIALAREYGTVPLLVLTSLTERGTFSSKLAAEVLANEALATSVINSVVQTVTAKGYGGVDVDFEYIPAEYSVAYPEFVEQLSAALGEEYPVFVSLAPK